MSVEVRQELLPNCPLSTRQYPTTYAEISAPEPYTTFSFDFSIWIFAQGKQCLDARNGDLRQFCRETVYFAVRVRVTMS